MKQNFVYRMVFKDIYWFFYRTFTVILLNIFTRRHLLRLFICIMCVCRMLLKDLPILTFSIPPHPTPPSVFLCKFGQITRPIFSKFGVTYPQTCGSRAPPLVIVTSVYKQHRADIIPTNTSTHLTLNKQEKKMLQTIYQLRKLLVWTKNIKNDPQALWRHERQSAWMSKITHDGLTRSGIGCFIFVGYPYGKSGHQRVKIWYHPLP